MIIAPRTSNMSVYDFARLVARTTINTFTILVTPLGNVGWCSIYFRECQIAYIKRLNGLWCYLSIFFTTKQVKCQIQDFHAILSIIVYWRPYLQTSFRLQATRCLDFTLVSKCCKAGTTLEYLFLETINQRREFCSTHFH